MLGISETTRQPESPSTKWNTPRLFNPSMTQRRGTNGSVPLALSGEHILKKSLWICWCDIPRTVGVFFAYMWKLEKRCFAYSIEFTWFWKNLITCIHWKTITHVRTHDKQYVLASSQLLFAVPLQLSQCNRFPQRYIRCEKRQPTFNYLNTHEATLLWNFSGVLSKERSGTRVMTRRIATNDNWNLTCITRNVWIRQWHNGGEVMAVYHWHSVENTSWRNHCESVGVPSFFLHTRESWESVVLPIPSN